MQTIRRYGELLFDADCMSARHPLKGELHFTRSERALLLGFMQSPKRVLSRAQLLDAIASVGSDANDRNVDFLINRLRAKLGDSARSPRYIATRYGEGYVWIADARSGLDSAKPKALLQIGPIFGLKRSSKGAEPKSFLANLHAALALALPEGQVDMIDDEDHGAESRDSGARFRLELSFFRRDQLLDCAAALRDGSNGALLSASRLDLSAAPVEVAGTLAAAIKATIWDRLSLTRAEMIAPSDEPLELRLYNTTRLVTQPPQDWLQSEGQARRALAERPDDPTAALAVGMTLYSHLVMGKDAQRLERGATVLMEDEIEALAVASLPRIGNDPILLLGAAKLLLFIGRGYAELAEQLAEQAFIESTAFGPAFATLGQIRMYCGEFDAANDLYEHAIEHSEAGSDFRLYLLMLCCSAYLAAGDREGLMKARARLYAIKPQAEAEFGVLLTLADEPLTPTAMFVLAKFDATRARVSLTYLHYVSARLYEQESHRENIMRGPVTILTERFGTEIVSDEIWRSVPRLRSVITALSS